MARRVGRACARSSRSARHSDGKRDGHYRRDTLRQSRSFARCGPQVRYSEQKSAGSPRAWRTGEQADSIRVPTKARVDQQIAPHRPFGAWTGTGRCCFERNRRDQFATLGPPDRRIVRRTGPSKKSLNATSMGCSSVRKSRPDWGKPCLRSRTWETLEAQNGGVQCEVCRQKPFRRAE